MAPLHPLLRKSAALTALTALDCPDSPDSPHCPDYPALRRPLLTLLEAQHVHNQAHLFLLAGNNFGQPFYSRWMQEFACLMNGNWYSTQAVSECKGEPDDSCWWQLNSPVRGEVVVNGESSNA